MTDSLRIVFAGTPEFAVLPLQALLESGQAPLAVYTQPDRPAGRGRKLTPGPVKQLAEHAGLEVRQPVSLRGPDAAAQLAQLQPDLLVVVAYGLILPQAVLDVPRLGCWNIHASLLPRWRGAAPIQRAILAGDAETGVCIMQMEAGLDTGPVLGESRLAIGHQENAESLHDRLAILGAEALLDCLERRQSLRPRVQSLEGVTYAHKLSKAEAELDWNEPATLLARAVRAFNPWPVAQADVLGERLRIWAAEARPGGGGQPGQVMRGDRAAIEVATGGGVLALTEVQRPGGKRISASDYLNARPELKNGG